MAEVAITDFYDKIDYLLELQPILPGSFNLSQNYPNPFNPVTNIQFDIPAHENGGIQVQLNIYNVVGQLIRTLVDETKFPGQYIAQWDGRNETGEKVPSGVYFYTLTANKFKETRKMILLK
jgi:flagellar hook assembly protein FlgD